MFSFTKKTRRKNVNTLILYVLKNLHVQSLRKVKNLHYVQT